MESILSTNGAILIVCVALGAAFFLKPPTSFKPIHKPSQSAVLVTGGARGIGNALAHHLMAQGYLVFVTVRSEKQYNELLEKEGAPCPVILDVTKDEHVDPAVQRVKEVCAEKQKTLVAIVNNAGINPEVDAFTKNLEAPDALADPAVASRVFETNVVGVIRVTRAFLPLLPEKGRIVNIGSYFGSVAGMTGLRHAAYEASKFALEGLTDNMRRALNKEGRGIHASLVKPGNIDTDMNNYGEDGPDVVARDVEHAIGAPSPRNRYYPGKVKGYSVRFLCGMFEMLPASVTDKF